MLNQSMHIMMRVVSVLIVVLVVVMVSRLKASVGSVSVEKLSDSSEILLS